MTSSTTKVPFAKQRRWFGSLSMAPVPELGREAGSLEASEQDAKKEFHKIWAVPIRIGTGILVATQPASPTNFVRQT